ncbi:acyltransferase ChoActase/COT/CPT [Chlamydoabsidia padenii]|nr:acyltransferase ChoActase/COT/CPT [Chlamydoabsidia padenii]
MVALIKPSRFVNNPHFKTFANQKLLPPLPFPELKTTGERYKQSLIPLLNKDDHQRACATIDQFTHGRFGMELQARLHRLKDQEAKKGYSWLYQLWRDKAYLADRSSTLAYINYWLPFKSLHNQDLATTHGVGNCATPLQLDLAAHLVANMVNYSNRINSEQIEPLFTSSGPLCMQQLKNIYGSSRIPGSPVDKSVSQHPASANHITATYKNQLFSVQVMNGDHVSVEAIKKQLYQLVDQIETTPETQHQLPIGLFTTEKRDTWANIRACLETNPDNAYNLNLIDTSLFVLCLDNYAPLQDLDTLHLNYAHGQGGYNRWFDKSIQVIVDTKGSAGMNMEHSLLDALLQTYYVDGITKMEPVVENDSLNLPLSPPRLLKWTSSDTTTIKNALQSAEANAKKLIDDLDCGTLLFNDYGSNFIKSKKISPDGWVQMVIQLAYYRLHGHPCPTYEASSTCRFLTGRTDIIRTCSEHSVAFTKIWDEKDTPIGIKMDYFMKALASHRENTIASNNGQGIDAHLFGLYHQMTPEEARSENAAIFQDPIYDLSQSWVLSTSTVPSPSGSYYRYGPVVDNGYGVFYEVKQDQIVFTLSSHRHSSETDLVAFRKSLVDVLADLAETVGYFKSDLGIV